MQKQIEVAIPYRGHITQIPFHQAISEYEWRAALGGTGSGKTYLGTAELVCYCNEYRGVEGVAFSPTFPMIKRNVLPVLRALLGGSIETSPLVQDFNKGDMHITWANGSSTWFNSLEYPERAEGQSLDYVWIDEARLVRDLELALQVIQRRLRGSPGGRLCGAPISAWITTTPDGPGSDLHKFLEDPKDRNPRSQVFRMSLLDNRDNLPPSYIDNIIRTHTGGLYERFVEGRFAAVAEGSFQFDYTKHVVDSIDLSILRRIVYGVDFGWDNPSAIIVAGLDGDNRAYLLDEYYRNRTSIDQLIQEAKDMIAQYGRGPLWCDPTEKQTIQTMRRAGLDARANEVKREDGIHELGGRFQLQGDGRYRIYVHRRCVNTIAELQVYDAEKKVNDHAVDGIRYLLAEVMKGRSVPVGAVAV